MSGHGDKLTANPKAKYATSSVITVYHLIGVDNAHQTLCGLSVAPLVIDRPSDASTLHLTSRLPKDREPCKRCAAAMRDIATLP